MLCIFSEVKNIIIFLQAVQDCPPLCDLIMMLCWKPSW